MTHPQLYPSLLIGFGGYGRDVTTRLLWSAAARGVLPRIQASASDELRGRIQDLEAVVVPNASATRGAEPGPADLLTDLRRQVVQVEAGESRQEAFSEAVRHAADRLLRSDGREGQMSGQRLDVYVLLHADEPATLGDGMALLHEPISRLHETRALRRVAQGASLLNVVLLLDIDDFWGSDPTAAAIRRGVRNVLQERETVQGRGGWGFSKVHLLDGDATTGRRNARERIDEAALLLEFLLYEGVRTHKALRTLVERSMNDETPLISVGIRSIERSSSRLSRLAAAAFGAQWMGWLHRVDDANDPESQHADQLIADLAMDEQRISGPPEVLDGMVRRHLDAFVRAATSGLTEPEWPAHVDACVLAAEKALDQDLYRWADERQRAAGQAQVGRLEEAVTEAVDALLVGRSPVSLGGVVRRLEALRKRLARIAPLPEAPAATVLDGVTAASAEFARFRSVQLDPLVDHPWWVAYGALVAAGAVPVIDRTLGLTPADHEALSGLALPGSVISGLALMVGVVHFRLYRPLVAQVRRARDFYIHPERGRLAAAVQSQAVEGGALHLRFRERAARAREDLLGSVRAMAVRQVDTVLARLQDRHREVRWLQGQLVDFLQRNDVDTTTFVLTPRTSPNRHAIEQADEVQRFLAPRTPNVDAFRAAMRQDRPLEGWNKAYSEALLDPLRFLETQSTIYPDPADPRDPATTAMLFQRMRLLVTHIRRIGSFPAPFRWAAEAGAVEQRYATMPAEWTAEDIYAALAEVGVMRDRVEPGASPDRCYLLTVASNVPLDALAGT